MHGDAPRRDADPRSSTTPNKSTAHGAGHSIVKSLSNRIMHDTISRSHTCHESDCMLWHWTCLTIDAKTRKLQGVCRRLLREVGSSTSPALTTCAPHANYMRMRQLNGGPGGTMPEIMRRCMECARCSSPRTNRAPPAEARAAEAPPRYSGKERRPALDALSTTARSRKHILPRRSMLKSSRSEVKPAPKTSQGLPQSPKLKGGVQQSPQQPNSPAAHVLPRLPHSA